MRELDHKKAAKPNERLLFKYELKRSDSLNLCCFENNKRCELNLYDLLSSRDLIDASSNVRRYSISKCYDDIFRVVTDYCYISTAKGLWMGTIDGISSMPCDFNDKYTEELFCIFIRGVCNLVDYGYISFLIDDYCNTYANKCDDNIRRRVNVLAMLLNELLDSFNKNKYLACLEKIHSLSTLMASNETSNYCFDLISRTADLVKGKREE